MNTFTVHWSAVDHEAAIAPPGMQLFALWLAPMIEDDAFRDAGFTDFAEADALWEATAEVLLTRLLLELEAHGEPQLTSAPLTVASPWRSPFKDTQVLELPDQIELPMQSDSLPDTVVAFGQGGVTMRTGCGHRIYWITWPAADPAGYEAMVARLADPYPVRKTRLDWVCLL